MKRFTTKLDSVVQGIVNEHVAGMCTAIRKEMAKLVANGITGEALKNGNGQHSRRRAKKAKNIRPCIVPECGKPSRGPRFHFLCADHREDATKTEIKKWKAEASGAEA